MTISHSCLFQNTTIGSRTVSLTNRNRERALGIIPYALWLPWIDAKRFAAKEKS